MVDTDPVQGFVVPGTLSVTVTDPNVTDDLFIRWIAEYPPYGVTTRLLRDDIQVSHSADGKELRATRSVSNVSCLNLAPQTSHHPVTALVADRPFPNPTDNPGASPENLFTKLDVNALSAEAHWVLNVDCP